MPALRADGVRLYYERRGGGDPVVLLHGFTTSLAGNWEATGWLDLLAAEGLEAIALDFRSHGRSDRVSAAADCTSDVLAADVLRLLDHLRLDSAALFGFSMGGGVALRLATDRPERATSVVVAGVGDAALTELHDPHDVAQVVAAFETGRAPSGSAAERILRNAELAGNEPAALLPFLLNGGWPGGLRDVGPVQVPVLVVEAEHDQYMAGTERLRARLPHARLVEAPNRHHHDVLTDAGVRVAVVGFLRGAAEAG